VFQIVITITKQSTDDQAQHNTLHNFMVMQNWNKGCVRFKYVHFFILMEFIDCMAFPKRSRLFLCIKEWNTNKKKNGMN
jgi:hypothetical protein